MLVWYWWRHDCRKLCLGNLKKMLLNAAFLHEQCSRFLFSVSLASYCVTHSWITTAFTHSSVKNKASTCSLSASWELSQPSIMHDFDCVCVCVRASSSRWCRRTLSHLTAIGIVWISYFFGCSHRYNTLPHITVFHFEQTANHQVPPRCGYVRNIIVFLMENRCYVTCMPNRFRRRWSLCTFNAVKPASMVRGLKKIWTSLRKYYKK